MTDPPLRLREARSRDLDALYRLDQLCFEPGISFSRGQIRQFLRLPTAQAVIAETGGSLAGFAIGYLPRPGLGSVLTLDVDPGKRRHGVGRVLLEDLLARLKAAGARRVRLEVDVRNASAISFYASLGFVRSKVIPDYYGPGRDADRMERDLPGRRSRSPEPPEG